MAWRYGFLAAFVILAVAWLSIPASADWMKDGVLLCGEANYQSSVKTCPDDSGRVIAVWMDYRNWSDWDIYGNKVDAKGNVMGPSTGIPVCDAPNMQMSPALIPDGTGGAIVVWTDYRDPWAQIFGQRVDNGGNIIWAENGIAICDSMGAQDTPQIVPDGSGGAIIVWIEFRSGSWDIYGQRVNASGIRQWAEDGVPICTDGSDQMGIQAIPDGVGGAIISWFDYRNGDGDIYAQRVDSAGNVLYDFDRIVCMAPGYQANVRMAASPSGGALLAWYDTRDGYSDVFVQAIDQDGYSLWTTDGVPVCQGYWNKSASNPVSDGAGGMIVAWYDERDGETAPIYAQRIDSTGSCLWSQYGIKAIPIYWGESEIAIKADGLGGAIIVADVYKDYASPADINAQRLDAAGNLLWGAEGLFVCGQASDQFGPSLTVNEAGGAFIAWDDFRDEVDYSNIYCQYVSSAGLWGNPEPEIVSCLDVPGDEGGWVRIKTRASSQDPVGGIFGYNVWRLMEGGGGPMVSLADALPRLLDPEKAKGVRLGASQAAALGLPEGEWESVGFWFATRDTIYNIAVPTKSDSTEAGTPWETFIVTAHTATPGLFVASEPATGYSVDNLAPGMTPGFAGDEVASPPGLRLYWAENPASDLWKYKIHRGVDEFFVPDDANLIGSTEGMEHFDGEWIKAYGYFYKLVAVDRHGNPSPASLLRPQDINVGTLLQSYAASLAGSFVEIAWTVAEIDEGVSFHVLRLVQGGEFAELAPSGIEREGLSFSIVDRGVEPGTTYRYRVEVADESGRHTFFETQEISTPAMPLTLHQNHPNPFNPSTTIRYYLPAAAQVTLEIYSADGKLLSRLMAREAQPRGMHSVEWRGLDSSGRAASSGVYFYRLQAGKEILARKMVLLR